MNDTRSVLVVDEEPATRERLVSLLEDAGIGARGAASADEAFKDGSALLGELREAQLETPVMLLTVEYVAKPVQASAVLESVEQSFARRESARELVESALAEPMSLADLTALYTRRVLAQVGGNKVRAARILGINRRTLYRRAARRGDKLEGRNA